MSELISIVLCTYNGEKYLSAQLESLLSQSYPIHEIIIQDDCSIDSTWAIAKQYKQNYPDKFVIIRNNINLGWNINFLDALGKATGDYIACCDQDDIWEKDKIERQVSQIGDKWLHVCSSYKWIGSQETPIFSNPSSMSDIMFFYPYSGHQFLISKDLLPHLHVGIEVDMAHDKYIQLVATYKRKVCTSQDLLVHWRRHDKSATCTITISKQQKGIQKVLYTIKNLIQGKKSPIISKACSKYVDVLSYLDCTDGTYPNSKVYINLMKNMEEQTILSYIKAGVCIIKLREDFFKSTQLGVRVVYGAMLLPYKWWAIHQYNV